MSKKFLARTKKFIKYFLFPWLIIIVPLIIVSAMGIHGFSDAVEKQTITYMLNTVEERHLILKNIIEASLRENYNIAHNPLSLEIITTGKQQDGDFFEPTDNHEQPEDAMNSAGQLPDYLRRLLHDNTLYENVFFLDRDGNYLVDGLHGAYRNIIFTEMDFYKTVLTGRQVIQDVIISPLSNRPVIIIAAPVLDMNDNFAGIAGSVIDFNRLSERIVRSTSDINYEYGIVNLSGNVIAHTNNDYVFALNLSAGNDSLNAVYEKMMNFRPDYAFYEYNGREMLAAFTVFRELNWFVYCSGDVDDYKVYVNQVRVMFYFVLLVSIVTASLVMLSTAKVRAINTELTETQQALQDSEEKLKIEKEAAEAATLAKSDFLANMSHEIRTPMNAIIGLNDLLEQTSLNSKQLDYVLKTGNAAKNLLGIINDILDFSKVEAGKMTMEHIDFNLEDVLDNIAIMAGPKASDKGLELVIDKSPLVPSRLKGDPLRLGQVLTNLADNAIKFTEQGEVILRISCEEQDSFQVRLTFSVEDSGIGMTPAQIDQLFSAFIQADVSTTRKYGGTGLGLTISKNIVEMMNGSLKVKSEYGKGSCFYFTASFPPGEKIKPQRETTSDIISDIIKGLKVLAVDDNPAALKVISAYLEHYGIRHDTAASGEEAVEKAGETYDLLLMDLSMPGISGVEARERIRAKSEGRKEPAVIFIADYSQQNMPDNTGAPGADEVGTGAVGTGAVGTDEVLTKPVSQSALLNAILKACGAERKDFLRRARPAMGPALNKIRGAKILLVEDNEINQQVAGELLESEGFQVHLADNGAVAYEKIRQEHYDLVLMDLQMPVLDGFSATGKIRADSSIPGELPVIALTADAISGTRNKALAAGMNDYITKPINKAELFKILKKWIRAEDITATAGAETDPLRQESETRLSEQLPQQQPSQDATSLQRQFPGDKDSLRRQLPDDAASLQRQLSDDEAKLHRQLPDDEASLQPQLPDDAASLQRQLPSVDVSISMERLGGDGQLYGRILKKFANNFAAFPERLKNMSLAEDSSVVARELHTLKGVAANIGAGKIQKTAAYLEEALRKGDDIFGAVEFEQLENELAITVGEINLLEDTPRSQDGELMTKEQLQAKISDLKDLLNNYDVRAVAAMAQIRTSLYQPEFAAEISAAEQRMWEYDFEGVLAIIEALEVKIMDS